MMNHGPKQKKKAAAPSASQADARLMLAAKSGSLSKARAALKEGADPNARYQGETALMIASREGLVRLMDLLVEAGADLNARGAHGTALGCAAQGHSPGKAIRWLLSRGADPNLPDWNGNAPVHELSRFPKNDGVAALSILIAAGVNLGAQNKEGNTPVHEAARSGFLAGIEIIERAGADIWSMNAKGLDARALAAMCERAEALAWFSHRSTARSQAVAISKAIRVRGAPEESSADFPCPARKPSRL